MVRMKLSRIVISETSENQIIVLKEENGERQFPILIGIYEATAIDRSLKEIRAPRPLTHDLVCSIITALDAEVERVVVCDLRNTTFYARIILRHDGKLIEVDSRPSDAIAIATQLDAPIYVDEKVIEQVGQENA
ncbi:MAG TPA: bifunctional nuclease family protein [Candidatus Brocadiia bacterium]|nr:bifunctional nuclease family protein [Candidatus Brocadiia bacterium]